MPPIPEHENKVPLWKTTSFWAGVGVVALTVLSQVAHLLPKDSPAVPYVGALVAVGLALQEGQVRASRNAASAQVEAAKATASAATLPVKQAIEDAAADVTTAIDGAVDEIGDAFEDAVPSAQMVDLPANIPLNDLANMFGQAVVKAMKMEKIQ